MSTPLDTPAAVRRAAMDLLAQREHGQVELSRKLLRRGAAPELIEQAVQRLAEEGLLNEGRYLESFIASRARAGHGALRIREELAQRGLPREAIAAALQAAEVDWQALLHGLWQKRFGQWPADARERAKQARFLAYRGYSAEQINRLWRGARGTDD